MRTVSRAGPGPARPAARRPRRGRDRKSTRLNSSHLVISYAVFCLKKKKKHFNKFLILENIKDLYCKHHEFLHMQTSLALHKNPIQKIGLSHEFIDCDRLSPDIAF